MSGIHIPARTVRVCVAAMLALIAAVLYHEYPGIRRYLKIERM